MSQLARPIYLPGATAVKELRQRAQGALDAWARHWARAGTEHALHVSLPDIDSAVQRSRDYLELCNSNGGLWMRRTAGDRLGFAHAVVGPELIPRGVCADELVAGVIDHAWRTLCRGLYAALVGELMPEASDTTGELPAELFAFGSGAVQLSCGSLGLHAIADCSVWRSLAPPEYAIPAVQTIVPLDRAAQRAAVRLDVMLGSVELELPDVLDLRRGDVLRLPHRLDEPLTVLCEGRPFTRAMLGEYDGRKSVRLVMH